MKLITSLPALVACAALLAGCAPKDKPKPNVSASTNAALAAVNEGVVAANPASAVAPAAGVTTVTPASTGSNLPVIGPAPAWKLKDLDGKEVSLADFKGKVVVLDFWATWCPPCRAEIPGYVDLYKKYGKDRLVIVGASVDEGGPQVVKQFVTKFSVNYPIVMADEAVVSAYGGIDAIPTTFLIDRNGQIRDKKVGAEPTEEYEKKIASLLQ